MLLLYLFIAGDFSIYQWFTGGGIAVLPVLFALVVQRSSIWHWKFRFHHIVNLLWKCILSGIKDSILVTWSAAKLLGGKPPQSGYESIPLQGNRAETGHSAKRALAIVSSCYRLTVVH